MANQPGSRASSNPDTMNKMINQMNKACNNVCELLNSAVKDELDVEAMQLNETCNQIETEKLVLGVNTGIGLLPNTTSSASMQSSGGAKYAGSVKAAIKTANMGQPYSGR